MIGRTSDADLDALNPYSREREAIIAANSEKLASLFEPLTYSALERTGIQKKRSSKAKRTVTLPTRRSDRIKALEPTRSMAEEVDDSSSNETKGSFYSEADPNERELTPNEVQSDGLEACDGRGRDSGVRGKDKGPKKVPSGGDARGAPKGSGSTTSNLPRRFNSDGLDDEGYDRGGYHHSDGFNREGVNKEGRDRRGYQVVEVQAAPVPKPHTPSTDQSRANAESRHHQRSGSLSIDTGRTPCGTGGRKAAGNTQSRRRSDSGTGNKSSGESESSLRQKRRKDLAHERSKKVANARKELGKKEYLVHTVDGRVIPGLPGKERWFASLKVLCLSSIPLDRTSICLSVEHVTVDVIYNQLASKYEYTNGLCKKHLTRRINRIIVVARYQAKVMWYDWGCPDPEKELEPPRFRKISIGKLQWKKLKAYWLSDEGQQRADNGAVARDSVIIPNLQGRGGKENVRLTLKHELDEEPSEEDIAEREEEILEAHLKRMEGRPNIVNSMKTYIQDTKNLQQQVTAMKDSMDTKIEGLHSMMEQVVSLIQTSGRASGGVPASVFGSPSKRPSHSPHSQAGGNPVERSSQVTRGLFKAGVNNALLENSAEDIDVKVLSEKQSEGGRCDLPTVGDGGASSKSAAVETARTAAAPQKVSGSSNALAWQNRGRPPSGLKKGVAVKVTANQTGKVAGKVVGKGPGKVTGKASENTADVAQEVVTKRKLRSETSPPSKDTAARNTKQRKTTGVTSRTQGAVETPVVSRTQATIGSPPAEVDASENPQFVFEDKVRLMDFMEGSRDAKEVVGHGMVLAVEGAKAHGVTIQPGHVSLHVLNVSDKAEIVPLPIPDPFGEVEFLNQAIGKFIVWPVNMLEFDLRG